MEGCGAGALKFAMGEPDPKGLEGRALQTASQWSLETNKGTEVDPIGHDEPEKKFSDTGQPRKE